MLGSGDWSREGASINYLGGAEAHLPINNDLEVVLGLSDLDHRRLSKVAIRVVTVTKCHAVDAMVAGVVDGTIVQEATNAAALLYCKSLLFELRFAHQTALTFPPWVSTTRTRPSNLLTVYMLDV